MDYLGTKLAVPDRLAAFDDLVETHRDSAVRLAYRLSGGDAATAEDIAQNAFLRAYQGLSRFRGDSALSTWFHSILVREVHRHRRRQVLRQYWNRPNRADDDVADQRVESDTLLRRRINQALAKLTQAQREAFVLVHMEGFTVAEAAEILGKAAGTIKSHLHRALEALRTELADVGAETRSAGVEGACR